MDDSYPNEPIRGRIEELPKFFAYFSNHRAIVINPLFNPLDGVDADLQPESLKESAVSFVGFETTENSVIEKLREVYRLTAERLLTVNREHAQG